jgi:hypothetical protein
MLTDEATIMHTAAVLAAAQYSANKAAADGGATPSFRDSAVDVLINVLPEMEEKRLIGPGFAPPRTR